MMASACSSCLKLVSRIELQINWKANCYDEGLWFAEAKIVILSYEQKYFIPNVGLYIKLKLLKIAIRWENFKTSAKRNIFLKYKNNCHSAKKWQIIGNYFPFS
jgi:hypothetical protein